MMHRVEDACSWDLTRRWRRRINAVYAIAVIAMLARQFCRAVRAVLYARIVRQRRIAPECMRVHYGDEGLAIW